MARSRAYPFAYIAFDYTSQTALAYGSTAVDALQDADRVAPDAAIFILRAGRLGWRVWNRRLDLSAATEVIDGSFPLIAKFLHFQKFPKVH